MVIPENSAVKDLKVEVTASRDGYKVRASSEKWNRYVDSDTYPAPHLAFQDIIHQLFEIWCEPRV